MGKSDHSETIFVSPDSDLGFRCADFLRGKDPSFYFCGDSRDIELSLTREDDRKFVDVKYADFFARARVGTPFYDRAAGSCFMRKID
ncbi:hypothetical protein HNV12_01650 [Methanococcoides sp. SA1]|nr:hypothetical protein [Methanococcoides sp. SA1]